MFLCLREAESWLHCSWRDAVPVHVFCVGEGEVLEKDRIVEIPAVGNGIDDWVGDGVGFEEAGAAADADGFVGGVFREDDAGATRDGGWLRTSRPRAGGCALMQRWPGFACL